MPVLIMRKGPAAFLWKRLPSRNRAPRYLWDKHSRLSFLVETGSNACRAFYAVNEVPQPQLPVAFGFVKVNPDPITPVT